MHIFCDNQVQNLFDEVNPENLQGVYRDIFFGIGANRCIETKRHTIANQLLVEIDGTEYHSSQKFLCDNCNHRELSNEKINYFHSALTPVNVQPGNESVNSLEPEFIIPQDGHEKQDFEIQAAKRWIEKHGAFYAKLCVTILVEIPVSDRSITPLLINNKSQHRATSCTGLLLTWHSIQFTLE